MKFFILFYVVILMLGFQSEGYTSGNDYLTVGPLAAGACDYTTIQGAINESMPTQEIRVVTSTYQESIGIIDRDATIIGGFLDCNAAANDVREVGAFSTLDPFAHGILIDNNPFLESKNISITGFHIINGIPGFVSSGGVNVSGDVNVTINESRIAGNTGINGGGIYIESPAFLYLQDTLVVNNEANQGGGIYCSGCTLLVNGNSGISANQALSQGSIEGSGGGIYLINGAQAFVYSGSGSPSLNDLGIHANFAQVNGGGIFVESSSLTLNGHLGVIGLGDENNPVNVTNNLAVVNGGGLYATDGSQINAMAIDISNNLAGNSAGGIYIRDSIELNINLGDPTIQSCWSNNRSKCNRIMNNSIMNGSNTDGLGGAIAVFLTPANIKYVWFEGNDAGEGKGAVIRVGNGELSLESSVLYNNGHPSGNDETAVELFGSNSSLLFNTIVDNDIVDAIIRFNVAPPFGTEDLNVSNTIIHNNNTDNVFRSDILDGGDASVGDDPSALFGCVLVHDDTSLFGSLTNVKVGNPEFFDRSAGNLHLTSNSVLAIDQCNNNGMLVEFDMDLENRDLDIVGVGEDGLNVSDIGADEYIGNDMVLDIIFIDGFE